MLPRKKKKLKIGLSETPYPAFTGSDTINSYVYFVELSSELVIIHDCILYAFLLKKVGFQVGRINSLCCPLPLITAFLFLFDQLICGIHVNIDHFN